MAFLQHSNIENSSFLRHQQVIRPQSSCGELVANSSDCFNSFLMTNLPFFLRKWLLLHIYISNTSRRKKKWNKVSFANNLLIRENIDEFNISPRLFQIDALKKFVRWTSKPDYSTNGIWVVFCTWRWEKYNLMFQNLFFRVVNLFKCSAWFLGTWYTGMHLYSF